MRHDPCRESRRRRGGARYAHVMTANQNQGKATQLPDEGALGRIPRYFLDDSALITSESVTINGALAQRLGRVMRARPGDELQLIEPSTNQLLQAVVDRVTRDQVICELVSSESLAPRTTPSLVLWPALIRPQRFDWMLEKVTELGVDEVRPVITERTIARGAVEQRLGRWRRIVVEASEQCRRDYVPLVTTPTSLAELLARERSAGCLRIVASAIEPDHRIVTVLQRRLAATASLDEVHLLVGPEGGLTPKESARVQVGGWRPISLGDRPLRAETASIAAVALALDALRDRSGLPSVR